MAYVPTRNSVWIVLQNSENKYLLLKRSKKSNNAGEWNFPGGGIEGNEDTTAAGAREFHEECGVNLNGWKHFLTIDNKERRMNYISPIKLIEPAIHINSESSKYGWFTLKEAREKNLHFPTLQYFKHITNKKNLEYRKRLVQGQLFLDITASLGSTIVSCAKICIPSRKLHNVHVEPFFRGLGYASDLMKKVMALESYPLKLTANPSVDSNFDIKQLVDFYRKFGFEETSVLSSAMKSGPVTMKLVKYNRYSE